MKFSFPVASCADSNSLRMQVVRSMTGGYLAQLLDDSQIISSEKHRSLRGAQQALLSKVRSMHGDTVSPVVWERISISIAPAAAVFIGWLFLLYGLPTLIEFLTLKAGGRLSYLLSGDLFAYLVIFLIGRRRLAITTYIAARVSEIWLVKSGFLPLDAMLWVSDAIPSLLASSLLCVKLFFLPERSRSESARG